MAISDRTRNIVGTSMIAVVVTFCVTVRVTGMGSVVDAKIMSFLRAESSVVAASFSIKSATQHLAERR